MLHYLSTMWGKQRGFFGLVHVKLLLITFLHSTMQLSFDCPSKRTIGEPYLLWGRDWCSCGRCRCRTGPGTCCSHLMESPLHWDWSTCQCLAGWRLSDSTRCPVGGPSLPQSLCYWAFLCSRSKQVLPLCSKRRGMGITRVKNLTHQWIASRHCLPQ